MNVRQANMPHYPPVPGTARTLACIGRCLPAGRHASPTETGVQSLSRMAVPGSINPVNRRSRRKRLKIQK